MARPLFHPGISVHLLVTVLWLWHGGTAVLAQEPSPVSLLTVISRNESSLTLEWTVPSDTNQTLYRYEVKWSVLGDTSNQTFPSRGNTSTVQTEVLAGLSPGVSYNITVFSLSPSGDRSNGTSLANATTSPSPATSLTVTARNDTSLTLQWTVPNDTNHDSYSYQVWVGPTRNENFTSNTIGGKQTVVIGGLLPGVTYNLTVYSRTSDGILSTSSNLANQTTSPSPVTSLTVTARNDTSLTLQWTVPNNTNQGSYSYQVWVGSTRIENFTSNAIGGKQTVVIGGLLPGVTYNLTVYSRTSDGILSTSSNLANQTTNPNPPENLMGSPSNDTAILVNWTAPPDPNANNYNYTALLYNIKNAGENHTYTTSADSTSFTSLFPGNLYLVSVISQIGNAISIPSQTYAQTNPQTVNSLTPPVITNTTATFTWDLDLQNMSELSEFQIKAILQNGTTDTQPINSSLRNYTFMNLIPGTNYTFEFRSVRTSNAQPLSSRRRRQIDTSLVTYSRAIVQYAQTDPGTVYAIQCTVLNGGYTLGVKWDCPQGAFTQFKVLVNDKENKAVNKCEGVTVTNLQPASDYKISVQTIAGLKAVTSFPEKCKTDATGVIVGAIFGVLLFLVLIALIIFFVLKRRRANGGSGSGRSVSMRRFPVNIPVDKFPAYFRQQHADSDFGFAEEYQLLGPIGTDQVQTAAQQFENKSKNRYTNVLPYDISRVKLHSLLGDPNSDYINANYMPGYNSNKEFIATQGPLPTTIGDFWRMVWEHRVGTMVMLTNCTEGGKLKCEHYWPLDYTPCTYDDITVAVTSETILPQWTTREFTLRHAKESGIRYVSHFHYTVWPDHGVPAETATVIRFRNMVREHMDDRKSNGPAIVHCSAGVGRTGTLIALDYLMQQVENEKVVGIFNFIKKMRLNRPFMVQTESQYIFLNQCMLDVIEHPNTEMENIYENQIAGDLIYENFDAMKQYGKPNGKLA